MPGVVLNFRMLKRRHILIRFKSATERLLITWYYITGLPKPISQVNDTEETKISRNTVPKLDSNCKLWLGTKGISFDVLVLPVKASENSLPVSALLVEQYGKTSINCFWQKNPETRNSNMHFSIWKNNNHNDTI